MQKSIPRRLARYVAVGSAVTAVGAVGIIGERFVSNFDNERPVDQQLNDAINEAPIVGQVPDAVQEAAEAADNAPVIGRADELSQTILDRPESEAEACLRRAEDLRTAEQFEPQYETGQQIAAQIAVAGSRGEVIGLLDEFLDSNGIELYYNSVSHPAKLDMVDWTKIGPKPYGVQEAKFDDTVVGATDVMRSYAIGSVLGLSMFSKEFNQATVDYMVFAGGVRDESAATAYHGPFWDGIVMEMDADPSIPAVIARTVHEVAHTGQYRISRQLGLPIKHKLLPPYNSIVPPGFDYAEASNTAIADIASSHPEYFVAGPDHAFVMPYSTTNIYEHGATTVADMLVNSGVIGTDSPSWGSVYQQHQASWLTCLEVAMPGFTDQTLQRQLNVGLISGEEAYDPYLGKTPEQIATLTSG